MAKIRSYKGVLLDSEMLFGDDSVPSIGNMNVNAGGDIIDVNGNVVKTRDQVAREYHVDTKKSVVTSSILDDIDDDEYTIEPPTTANKRTAATKKQEIEKQEIEKQDTKDESEKGNEE